MRKQALALAQAHVTLGVKAQKILSQDIRQRRHIEACGLLIGQMDAQGNWQIEHAQPLRNIFNSPVYFEFAPEDLLEAELDYPGLIVGVYHTHPTGFGRASSTDRKNMQRVNIEEHIPWLWLIVCGPFDDQFTITGKNTPMIAYHHYHKTGLMQVPIQLHSEEEKTQ